MSTSSIGSIESHRPLAGGRLPPHRGRSSCVWRLAPGQMPTARRQTKTTRPARLLKGLGNAKRNEASPTLSIASTVSNLPRAGGPASPSSRPVALRLAPRAWPDANLKTPDETARPARRLKGLGNAKRNEASPTLSTSSIGSIESNRPLAGTGFPAPRPVAWRLAPRAWPDAKRKTPDENAATRAAPQRPRKREAERGDPDFVDFVDCVDCVEPAARRGPASPHRGRSSCVWRLAPGPTPIARRQTKRRDPRAENRTRAGIGKWPQGYCIRRNIGGPGSFLPAPTTVPYGRISLTHIPLLPQRSPCPI